MRPRSTFDRSRNNPKRCKRCGRLEHEHRWICDDGHDVGSGDYNTPVPCHGGATLYCPRVSS